MTSLAFRRTNANNSPYLGRQIPWLNVILGQGRRKPAVMERRQTSLNSSGLMQVYGGGYSLPPQPAVAGLAPFNIVFPFSAPYVYQRSGGDLFIKMSAYNATGLADPFYDLDGHVDSFDGDWFTTGQRGQTSRNENYQIEVVDKYQLAPGGTVRIRAHGFSNDYLGILGLGFSKSSFQGVPLPLDLARFGAPGNSLQHSWDVMLPFSVQLFTHGVRLAEQNVLLATSALFYGVKGYAQFLVADPPKNQLGLVFSDLLEMKLLSSPPVSQSIMTINNSLYSYMIDRDTMGGPVMRLTGTFN